MLTIHKKLFNIFVMKKTDKFKVIMDVDPGVDDATNILFAATDPRIDIKLISVVDGNVGLEQSTQTVLYLLDELKKDIPVVKGVNFGVEKCYSMHGLGSLGGVAIPKKVKHKTTNKDVADAMMELLTQYPHEITLLCSGPLTNIRYLFSKYPRAKEYVKRIIFMGGSFGLPGQPGHISYNSRTDPEAMDCVVNSGVPCVMVQSLIGRTKARFDETQVANFAKMSQMGQFIYQTFDTYWEPGFDEKFVSNNDVCTYLYLVRPDMFSTEAISIKVDLVDKRGKLTKRRNKNSSVLLVTDLNRAEFLEEMFLHVANCKKIKINFKPYSEVDKFLPGDYDGDRK